MYLRFFKPTYDSRNHVVFSFFSKKGGYPLDHWNGVKTRVQGFRPRWVCHGGMLPFFWDLYTVSYCKECHSFWWDGHRWPQAMLRHCMARPQPLVGRRSASENHGIVCICMIYERSGFAIISFLDMDYIEVNERVLLFLDVFFPVFGHGSSLTKC